MKVMPIICFGLCWLLFTGPTAALAQANTSFTFNNLNLAIPDGDPNGVANSQNITGVSGSIASIQISLDIAGTGYGAFNGDLYAELVDGSGGLAVLLNRVGASSGNPAGYSDNGFAVTFDDAAANDVHFYQSISYNLNSAGQLTGAWQPDGEDVSPLANPATFDNARQNQTAMLSSFYGHNPNETWTLFLADVSPGGTAQLVNWSITVTTVPEPGETRLFIGAMVCCAFILRRRWVA